MKGKKGNAKGKLVDKYRNLSRLYKLHRIKRDINAEDINKPDISPIGNGNSF